MVISNIPPKFLSLEFHTKFFPSLLFNRLRPKEEEGTSFVPHVSLVFTVAMAFCVILIVKGIPYALANQSIIGWMVGGTGIAGILAIFIFNIYSQWGIKPTYDDFLIGIFFFFVSLGISAGIFNGSLKHSQLLMVWGSLTGLFAGYVIGIFAGLYMQYLGWIAVLLNMLAGVSIIGMVLVDLVLLFG
ncbi:MAG: hypothetical protein A2889_10765 [Nitrospinae bacterium RIFCSPLOWO2_01_FULL_39_10]|nr:MAG: hypothetical protein A2889_10765 [Nitrospinae bacterium RIFCSPLOWO2_01_FULL_39_10]